MGASAPAGGGHLARRCPQPDPVRTRVRRGVRGGPGAPGVAGGWAPTPPRARGPRFPLQVRAQRGVTLPARRGSSGEAMGRGGAAGPRSGTARPRGLGWSAGAHGLPVRRVLQSRLGGSTARRRCAPLLPQPLHLLPDSPPRPPRAHFPLWQLAKPLICATPAPSLLRRGTRLGCGAKPGRLQAWPAPALGGLLGWLRKRVSERAAWLRKDHQP
ncbi:uncharacterized protein LOC116589700 [Mustela erminea]|uniref:uncharacterized protein LOC116589700 n=1 Tax=Mustela erminea TaxID=36723 RepID=UPI0013869E8B|nr:uncharacterized protein LOC116589700 [Mustela erminea]